MKINAFRVTAASLSFFVGVFAVIASDYAPRLVNHQVLPDTNLNYFDPQKAISGLSISISSDRTIYRVGEAPEIKVTISNNSDQDIYIVGCLDHSDIQGRYPYCDYEISSIPNPFEEKVHYRCGNKNALRVADFVHVPAHTTFDPFMKVDQYGFFGSSKLFADNFSKPGKYMFRFVYSSDSNNIDKWMGWPSGMEREHVDQIQDLFSKVPKATIKSNNLMLEFKPR